MNNKASSKTWCAMYSGPVEKSKFVFTVPAMWRDLTRFLKDEKRIDNLMFIRESTPEEAKFAKSFVSEHTDEEFIEDQADMFIASGAM